MPGTFLSGRGRTNGPPRLGEVKLIDTPTGRRMANSPLAASLALAILVVVPSLAPPAVAEDEDAPYTIIDGKVDFATYNGFRRYHSFCHVCHGPDGLGSSYAPALIDSLKTLSYDDYLEVVVNGRQNVNQAQQSVMPPFGTVMDVMLYVDDIYGYLKARADGVLPRGRPARLPKPKGDP